MHAIISTLSLNMSLCDNLTLRVLHCLWSSEINSHSATEAAISRKLQAEVNKNTNQMKAYEVEILTKEYLNAQN